MNLLTEIIDHLATIIVTAVAVVVILLFAVAIVGACSVPEHHSIVTNGQGQALSGSEVTGP